METHIRLPRIRGADGRPEGLIVIVTGKPDLGSVELMTTPWIARESHSSSGPRHARAGQRREAVQRLDLLDG